MALHRRTSVLGGRDLNITVDGTFQGTFESTIGGAKYIAAGDHDFLNESGDRTPNDIRLALNVWNQFSAIDTFFELKL